MNINSDEEASEGNSYIESDPDAEGEEVYYDDDYLDRSEDYEEIEGDGPLHEKPKISKSSNNEQQKKNKVNIWNEEEKIETNEKLDYDNEAYEMLHRAMPEWPCMSIDFIIPENFNGPISNFYSTDRSRYTLSKDAFPYTSYIVAGSQTTSQNGFLYAMKWFNMHKTKYDDDPDKGADSDEEEGGDPYMKFEKVQINGNVNKLHTMKNSYLCGVWSDSPSIEIVDLRSVIEDLEISSKITKFSYYF